MLGTHSLLAFLLSSALLWITPGSDTFYILTRSITQGRRAGLLSVLGISSGSLVHTCFAAFGLSALLAASAWAFTVVKLAGAAYLIYLGVQIWLKRSPLLPAPETAPISGWQIYRQGVITNVLNPKVALFFLAFLPQFVDPAAELGALPFLLLGSLFVAGSTVWCVAIALFAATATQTIRSNDKVLRWLERVSGCLYIALGLHLLRSEIRTA